MNNLNIKTVHICRTCMGEILYTLFFHLDFTQIDGEPTIGQKLSSCIPQLDLNIVPNTVICGKCADTINSLYIFKEECLRLEMHIHEYIQQVQHTGNAIDLAAVMQFHQLNSKSQTAELKTEAFEKTEYKIEESTTYFSDDYAFNETEGNTEIALGDIEKTENYKNDSTTSCCDNSAFNAFNETERYTEVVNRDFLISLAKVDRDKCVLFNTIDNFINSGKSEHNSDTHDDSNINIKTVHICRTCMEEIPNTSFFHLDFTRIDGEPTIGQKLSSCIPELDLNIVPNTVICGKCADTVNSLYIFKEECLRLEMHIREYIQQAQRTGNAIDLVAVMQFHQLNSKSLTAELKTEAFEKTDDYKNEESLTCFSDDYAFNETEGNTEIASGDIEKTENYKNEESTTSFCDNSAFNETERYTEVVNRDFLISLAKVDRDKCVLFNTIDNFINSGKSEHNSDTHDDSNIVQDCFLQVVENPGSCIQNLNETDIYYQCFTCEHKAESKLKLIRHLKSHTGEKLFKCSVCKYSCVQKNKLKRHLLTHTGEKPFKCSVCEYSCNHKVSLKSHILTHTGEKPFKCSVCEYSCVHKNNLKSHMLTHTGEKPFKCSVCEYSCNQKVSLKSHMLNHAGEKPFKCSVCEYSCVHKNNLKSHMLTHTGEKPFKCSVCEHSFNQKNNLKRHLLTHTGEKPFKCSVCEYSCNHKMSLNSHILTHTGEKPFKCSICEYSWNRKESLELHMLTHTGEKPFKCLICEYSCNHKVSLKNHMLTHTDEKSFKCSICEYSWNSKESLKLHMLSHIGEKPFKCSICEYSWNRKESLELHMLSHTGEKPFKCSICEYSCNHQGSLKNHMLNHT